MLTIRGRTIELAADPAQFEQPVPNFDNPGDAKLEADAYLALCIDQLTDHLSTSQANRQDFFNRFSPHVLNKFGRQPNRYLDHNWIKVTFIEDFRGAYINDADINNIFSTAPQIRNTKAACAQYLKLCEEHVAKHSDGESEYVLPASIQDYESPANLMHIGLTTLVHEVPHVLEGLNSVKPNRRPALLDRPVKGPVLMGSLSLAQLRVSDQQRAAPAVEKEHINTIPNIQVLRAMPPYISDLEAILRPFRGCPAMPELPATDFLRGGSGILKMLKVAIDLTRATNVYMLDSDLPEYSVTRTAQSYGEPVDKQIGIC